MTITRDDITSRGLTLDQAALEEIERLYAAGELGGGYRTVPQCHICCDKESKDLVNRLIAAGLTNREIAETCGGINARRYAVNDTRIIDARKVYNHKRNHFNVDAPAMSVVRRIMERRAEEANQDHINGIGHAVTPYAVLETTMVKGYEHLALYATPSVKETMDAAIKLHDMTRADAGQRKMADLLFQMDRIIAAIREVVPEKYHSAILARIEGREQPPLEAITDKVQQVATKAIKEFAPKTGVDERDEI